MRLGTAIERLVDNYRYASDKEWIRDKVAWALHHTWKEADHKTENSSEKPNNCEDEAQYDFGEYADRLWKIAYERGKREALEQTEPTISKMEQVEDEPQTDCNGCKFVGTYDTEFPCANCSRKTKDYYAMDEPQTERSE